MKKEELFEIIGEADEEKIAAAGEVLAADKKPRIIWFRVAATVAACLCLVFAGVLFFHSENSTEMPAINGEESSPSSSLSEQGESAELPKTESEVGDVSIVITEPMEGAHEASSSSAIAEDRSEISATPTPPPPADAAELITHFDIPYIACYGIPEPGKLFCEAEVSEAREHYAGENVRYLLRLNVFNENEESLSDEEMEEEYYRLMALGYEFYETESWTYQGEGEKLYFPIVVGMFTEQELADFPAREDYGYSCGFVSNGDGSAIDVDDLIPKPYGDVVME